jgi:hypothetical protein
MLMNPQKSQNFTLRHAREGGHPDFKRLWMPAFAGMPER